MGVVGLNRESIRDISGNLVPLAILVFFMLWFAVDAPWGWSLYTVLVVYGVLAFHALALLAITYIFARQFQTESTA